MPLFKFSTPGGISGAVVFPLLQVEAEVVRASLEFEGEIALPVISLAGEMGAEGAIAIPLLSITGRMQDTILGELRIHLLRVDGVVNVTADIVGDISIPSLSITGDMQAECAVVVPLLSISGFLQSEGYATGAIDIPCMRIAGTLTGTEWVAGAVNIPCLSVSGSMSRGIASIEGAITILPLSMSGSIIGMGALDYGNETDTILRFDAARRHI